MDLTFNSSLYTMCLLVRETYTSETHHLQPRYITSAAELPDSRVLPDFLVFLRKGGILCGIRVFQLFSSLHAILGFAGCQKRSSLHARISHYLVMSQMTVWVSIFH